MRSLPLLLMLFVGLAWASTPPATQPHDELAHTETMELKVCPGTTYVRSDGACVQPSDMRADIHESKVFMLPQQCPNVEDNSLSYVLIGALIGCLLGIFAGVIIGYVVLERKT